MSIKYCLIIFGYGLIFEMKRIAGECTDVDGFTTSYKGRYFTSCKELAEDPDSGAWLCMMYGWDGLECCASCEKSHGDINIDDIANRPSACMEELFELDAPDGMKLNCSYLAQTYPYSYYCKDFSTKCCDSCKNVDTECQDVPWNVTVRTESMNCRTMVSRYPLLCNPQKYGRECCISCKTVEYDGPCLVNPMMYWRISTGEELYCEDYISRDASVCHRAEVMKECCPVCKEIARCSDKIDFNITTENGDWINSCSHLASLYPADCSEDKYGGDGNVCCKSCQGIDATCTDSPLFFVTPSGEPVTSCEIVATRFSYYCKEDSYGGQENTCCQACKNVDISCVDDPNRYWTNGPGIPLYCEDAVQVNPLMCFSPGCCKSCAKLFQCDDDASVTISLPNDIDELQLDCPTLAEQYPYFCTTSDFTGDLGKCCASCQDIDTNCVDNPLYTFEEGNAAVYCSDLSANAESLYHLCDGSNNTEVREMCCKSCSMLPNSTLGISPTIVTSQFQATTKEPVADVNNNDSNSISDIFTTLNSQNEGKITQTLVVTESQPQTGAITTQKPPQTSPNVDVSNETKIHHTILPLEIDPPSLEFTTEYYNFNLTNNSSGNNTASSITKSTFLFDWNLIFILLCSLVLINLNDIL